jgi:hypothetical protein
VADLGLVQDAIARGETLEYVTKYVVPVPSTDALPRRVSWLNGLCDELQAPQVPP